LPPGCWSSYMCAWQRSSSLHHLHVRCTYFSLYRSPAYIGEEDIIDFFFLSVNECFFFFFENNY
jgi:hypothetical protein